MTTKRYKRALNCHLFKCLIVLAAIGSCLLLAGCGHAVLLPSHVKAHEEQHCRDWGITDSNMYRYHYTDNVQYICREKWGVVFVDGCAEKWSDGTCHIYLTKE